MKPRRFPPPWHAEQTPGGFKVLDASGQALAHLYARETPHLHQPSISVAVRTPAALRWRRSSRPVSYAIGNVGFSFPAPERRQNPIGRSPTRIFHPLRRGECRRSGEYDTREKYHHKFHLHRTPLSFPSHLRINRLRARPSIAPGVGHASAALARHLDEAWFGAVGDFAGAPTFDEARRIAVNVAKLPELLGSK